MERRSETELMNLISAWMVKYHPYWSNIVGMTQEGYCHDCRAFCAEELVNDIRYCIEYCKRGPNGWKEYIDECCYDNFNDLDADELKKPISKLYKDKLSREAIEEGEEIIDIVDNNPTEDEYDDDTDYNVYPLY